LAQEWNEIFYVSWPRIFSAPNFSRFRYPTSQLMTARSTKSSEHDADATDRVIRRLSARYFLVLIVVAALIVVDQAIIQPLLVQMNSYPPTINLAGRQRMLSQKLTKAALAMQAAGDDAQRQRYQIELQATLAQWSAANSALRQGDSATGLPKLASPEFNSAWADLQPHFEAMLAAGNTLIEPLASSQKAIDTATAVPPSDTAAKAPAKWTNAVSTIVDHETFYLSSMEKIVALLEHDADRQVALLRGIAIGIASLLIALLLILGWQVVRPATRIIRGQVDRMEFQIADRTSRLALANNSLRHEILQRQEAEIKNRALADQLAHAARVSTMGQFTAALTHEINQPLATIANYAETCVLDLAETAPNHSEKLRWQIEHIKQAAIRAAQIVRGIRNFVQPNRNAPLVDADLNVLVAEVVELCRLEAQRNEVQIALQLSAHPIGVLVNPIQIQQVLVNLFQNAIQAMNSCPASQRRLCITTNLADNNAIVSMRDSGPGIEIDADSLFAPFQTTKANGLGIGLSICRTIVESHQGQIWVDATDDSGTTVCFSLPLVPQLHASHSQLADCVCR
jgi:two-component system, LuxR family, sensor kinase FixL